MIKVKREIKMQILVEQKPEQEENGGYRKVSQTKWTVF